MATMSQPLSRSVVGRLPFFWWRAQAWPQPSRRTAAHPLADDAYIPSGTADLWRSSRPRCSR